MYQKSKNRSNVQPINLVVSLGERYSLWDTFGIVSEVGFRTHNMLVVKEASTMKVGYIRVSSRDQNTARQEVLLKDLGAEKLFIEKVSGKAKITDRPQLEALMNYVREGDTVIVESISRFGRNIRHFLDLLDILKEKNVDFVSVKEKFDSSTPSGRFTIIIFAALAELEREYILDRQTEGIAIAKAEGRFNGRPLKELDNFEAVYSDWKADSISAAKAAKKLGIARSTFYRRISKHEGSKVIDFGV
jgi:DNA invertase Pin-like site-specific DNA recombinase